MLLVKIIILLLSKQTKLAITFDLMPLRVLLMLITCILDTLMKYFTFSMLIGTITCLQDRPFIIILSLGLGFLTLLMIFWICSILWSLRFGNISLIFRVSLAIFVVLVVKEA